MISLRKSSNFSFPCLFQGSLRSRKVRDQLKIGFGGATMSSFFYWVILFLAITLIMSLKTFRDDERIVVIRLGRFLRSRVQA
jgi:regulator of protease activity HflC (stomatin/prohibitin superfamily)